MFDASKTFLLAHEKSLDLVIADVMLLIARAYVSFFFTGKLEWLMHLCV